MEFYTAYELVESVDQVKRNVIMFNQNLKDRESIVQQLSQFTHWYYIADLDLFGPSKFIGYQNMSASEYNFGIDKDGRETEKVLKQWFRKLDSESEESLMLKDKLASLLENYDKPVKKNAVIHVKL